MQIETELIFDLNKLEPAKDEKYLTAILTKDIDMMPMGTPIIIKESGVIKLNEPVETNKSNRYGFIGTAPPVVGLCAIAPRKNLHSNHVVVLKKHDFIVTGESFVNKHVVKKIDAFDMDAVSDIQTYINTHSSISFIIKDKEQAAGCMFKFQKNVTDPYNYSLLLNLSSNTPNSDIRDTVIPVFTFINLNCCMPIFNPKRVDGMTIRIDAMLQSHTEATGRLITLSEMTIVVSNYLDNIFIVDGQTINEFESVHNSTYESVAYALLFHNSSEGKEEDKERGSWFANDGGIVIEEPKLRRYTTYTAWATSASTATTGTTTTC